jgi:hypothetical protein
MNPAHKALFGAAAILVLSASTGLPVVAGNSIADHDRLLSEVQKAGVPVFIHSPVCQRFPRLHGAYNDSGHGIHLCAKGSKQERLRTIRHESWHLIQDLRNCNIKDTHDRLKPAFDRVDQSYIDKLTREGQYHPREVKVEAEAFWAQDHLSASDMADRLKALRLKCSPTHSQK